MAKRGGGDVLWWHKDRGKKDTKRISSKGGKRLVKQTKRGEGEERRKVRFTIERV